MAEASAKGVMQEAVWNGGERAPTVDLLIS